MPEFIPSGDITDQSFLFVHAGFHPERSPVKSRRQAVFGAQSGKQTECLLPS